jgi:hypothetical protein
MSNSVRLACVFSVIALATFALGPATAGSGSFRLAAVDSRPQHCKPALDGSQICTDDTGGGAGGNLGQDSPYMACRAGCGERARKLPKPRQSHYLDQCIPTCDRDKQRIHG